MTVFQAFRLQFKLIAIFKFNVIIAFKRAKGS